MSAFGPRLTTTGRENLSSHHSLAQVRFSSLKIKKLVKHSISLFFKDIYLTLLPPGPAAAGSGGEGCSAVSGARNVGFAAIVVLPFPETVRVGL